MTTKQGSSKSSGRSSKQAKGAKVHKNTSGQTAQSAPLISTGMRNDLVGIALAVIGIVLFVALIIPSPAVLSGAIADSLHHAFGIGAFFVPFAFVVWGVIYFFKVEYVSKLRIIIGIFIIIIALMGLLSLFNPNVDDANLSSLFDTQSVLINGGGYVGSSLTWLFMTLFGRIICTIVLFAIIVCGLVLLGISISTPFLFVKNFIMQKRSESYDGDSQDYEQGSREALFVPGTSNIDQGQFDYDDPDFIPESNETIMFGNKKRASLTKRMDKDDKTRKLDDAVDLKDTLDLNPNLTKTEKLSMSKSGSKTVRISKKKTTSKQSDEQLKIKSDDFDLPPMTLLRRSNTREGATSTELKRTAAHLQGTLEEFSLPAKVVGWLAGPTVTLFKVELPSGMRLAKLTNLSDDIALSLAASAVRIAQIPGTSLVGVEIPNKRRSTVLLGNIITQCTGGPLQVAIGQDVDGDKICADLSKMPHLLIAGTTGSGKSVCINAMIMTMLMRATPEQVRMILIDPKRVEMSLYNGIPHLYVSPVTEPKEAASALRWAVLEMEKRLKIFEQVGAKNIGMYNQMVKDDKLTEKDGTHPDMISYIVIVIDELSDLMMVAGKDVEDSIVRLAQLARAAGIHLIIATQRPSSNVVTGMIKANITNRIGLLVATNVDSRVILDQSGAEKLVGNGDMLFSKPEWGGKPKRIQGCFVSEDEITSVVEYLKVQAAPEYHAEILSTKLSGGSAAGHSGKACSTNDNEDDPLLWDAAESVVRAGLGSTSMLQRRLKVGYARAGRIMDMLEEKGIVGPPDGSHARDLLIDSVEDLEAIKAFEAQDQGEN